MRTSFVISIIIVFVVFGSVYAQEQERPTPPPRETEIPEEERIEREEPRRDRLPEFELPEYVITGRATFRLPYVHKPKITEQNIYVAEASKTMKGVARDIETSPVELPTKSFGEFHPVPSMQYGHVRLGFGRYNTPVISGWANYRSQEWDVAGRLGYMNTEGYESFAEGYDLDGRFQFGYRISSDAPAIVRGGRPYLTIGFEGHKYGVFAPGEVIPDTSLFTHPRTFRTGYSEIGFQSGTDAMFDYDLTLGWRGSTLEEEAEPDLRFNDDELYVQMSTLGYIESVRFKTDLKYISNSIDLDYNQESPGDDEDLTNPEINSPRFFKGQVTAMFPFSDNSITLELGGNFYSARGTHTEIESSIKPFVELRVMPFRAITVYGRFAPEMYHNSLYSYQHSHRYIHWWPVDVNDFLILPSDEKINVTAGIEYIPHRRINVNAYAKYREVEQYPAFESIDEYGIHTLSYLGKSTFFSVNGDVRYSLTDRDIITTQAALRYTKNDFYDTSIPYIAPVEIAAMYTRDFPFGLRTSAGVEFVSSRRAAFLTGDSDELGTFVNLNLDVQYQFHNIMGVYLKFDNILNQSYERYHTYPARPFYVEGGIQISF